MLAAGDFLPDINMNGGVVTGQGDDFDNREPEGITIFGGGTLNPLATGSDFTDIALSTSYDASSSAGTVYDANTNTYGSGGAFPEPPSSSLPIQPGFIFDFFVPTADIDPSAELFFNLVFGDYDVAPADVVFTRADGSTFTVGVATQPGAADGLIQEASTDLSFGDVFSATSGGYTGYLEVDFVADSEPYTAFDYVEISRTDDPGSVGVPDGGTTALMLGASLLGFGAIQRKLK